jgi:hypothetical protein
MLAVVSVSGQNQQPANAQSGNGQPRIGQWGNGQWGNGQWGNNQFGNQQFGNQQQPRQLWPRQNRMQQQQQAPNRIAQFSPTEYWNQQKAFFTEKAGLTEDEAKAFFPVYNELQQKKRELNREMRRIMREAAGAQATEDQSLKAIDSMAETNIKIAELEKEYLQKFKQILPASKILKVQNAEEQFNSQILKDIQQSRGHQFQQGQQFQQGGQRPMQPQFNWPEQKKE